ncbi:hypothetical protein JW897_00310 [Chromobacterium alkanivorans]|uniref:hypothetical protein n=1 Tax=Chromobacterium alkanivorans TaxID=1071719 RepID=UPI0019673918|nr:hypothetical protein [Chromobacterium alkanivorans]MBN3002167.1 hypothetical protein [Chromobacterium alkanivorans]
MAETEEDAESGSWRRRLAQRLRHERRRWRRLAYWLQQLHSDRPPLRCYAWRPAPEDVDDAASKR